MNRYIEELIEKAQDSKRLARANELIGGPWAGDITRKVDALQESIRAYCVMQFKKERDDQLYRELTNGQ